MATSTIVRSRSAIGVGVFFTAVTAYVLLEDVFRHGAPFTTKHLMTLAVLAGTVYFGHRWWTEMAAWRLGTMLGCAVLFVAGTCTCVIMSAGRNAEVVTTKTLVANAVNTDRERAQNDRDEAKASYLSALKAEEAECASGQGEKCRSKRITTTLRREDLDAAEKVLRAQKPEQIANADIRAAAELIARLPYVTAKVEAIEALLQLAFPFLQSLFCEIGAVVGFSIGLGHAHRRRDRPANGTVADSPTPGPGTVQPSRGTVPPAEATVGVVVPFRRPASPVVAVETDVLAYVRERLEAGETLPSQAAIVERFHLPKQSVSRWMAKWETAGLIARTRDGRRNVIGKVASPSSRRARAVRSTWLQIQKDIQRD